jgi:hypothetical protein
MDWDNEQICHWLIAVGLGEYVQLFRGMFVKLGITGKESSAFGGFAFPFGEGKTYHSKDKGRQFGLKIVQKKRKSRNKQVASRSILIYRNGKNTDNRD